MVRTVFFFFVDVDNVDNALLKMAFKGDKDDEYLEKFKKSISSVPDQIIRYSFFFLIRLIFN